MPDKTWGRLFYETIERAPLELHEMLMIEAVKGKAFTFLAEGNYDDACEWLKKALTKLSESNKLNTDEYALVCALLAVFQSIAGDKNAARSSIVTAKRQAKSPEMWDMLHNMPL